MRGSAACDAREARRVAGAARAARALVVVCVALTAVLVACGETRNPIGEECLRGDDCLSGVCSSRTCVAAPGLVTGGGPPPGDEQPRIPVGEGGSAPTDAGTGGQREGG